MTTTTTILVILAIIVCVLLGLIILIQNPKGGGLSSGFAGSNNIMGVQRTGDFLEKGTWFLIIALMVLSLLINVTTAPGTDSSGQSLQDQIDVKQPVQVPAMPSQAPAAAPGDSTKK